MDIGRYGQVEERVAAGAAGALNREDVLGQRLVARGVEFLAAGIVGGEDAFQTRGAEFARPQFNEKLIAGFHFQAEAIDLAVLLQAAVDHARNRHRTFHGFHQFRKVADGEKERQRGRVGECHAGECLRRACIA